MDCETVKYNRVGQQGRVGDLLNCHLERSEVSAERSRKTPGCWQDHQDRRFFYHCECRPDAVRTQSFLSQTPYILQRSLGTNLSIENGDRSNSGSPPAISLAITCAVTGASSIPSRKCPVAT